MAKTGLEAILESINSAVSAIDNRNGYQPKAAISGGGAAAIYQQNPAAAGVIEQLRAFSQPREPLSRPPTAAEDIYNQVSRASEKAEKARIKEKLGALQPKSLPIEQHLADFVPEGAAQVKKKNWISESIIIIFIIFIICGAFVLRNGGSENGSVFGYAGFNVLTRSMQSVYPQGSLVLDKVVDPNELKVGDDITYKISESASITHRIIEIQENFQNSGKRGFITQGVENYMQDDRVVRPSDIIGKVVWSSLPLGIAYSFIKNNVLLVILLSGLLIAFFVIIGYVRGKNEKIRVVSDELPEKHYRTGIQRRYAT